MKALQTIKEVGKSRAFLALFFVTLAQMVILLILVLTSARPSELQVPVHYSAFSSVHFYRDQWYYLLTFAVFAVMVYGVNSFVALKLYTDKGRSIALMFLWITVAVLFVSTILIAALLRVTNILQ